MDQFVNKCEQLTITTIFLIYENKRCFLVDQHKSTKLLRIQRSMSVVLILTIEENEDADPVDQLTQVLNNMCTIRILIVILIDP